MPRKRKTPKEEAGSSKMPIQSSPQVPQPPQQPSPSQPALASPVQPQAQVMERLDLSASNRRGKAPMQGMGGRGMTRSSHVRSQDVAEFTSESTVIQPQVVPIEVETVPSAILPYRESTAIRHGSELGAAQLALPLELEESPKSPADVSGLAEKMGGLRVHSDSPPQHVPPTEEQASQDVTFKVFAPASSKALRFPRRPGNGISGVKCVVKANHFLAALPKKDLHHYDVSISPEVPSRGVNRAVMQQLVKLHRETSLGQRLPVYDGRKSLYIAGPLPFQAKEFQITLSDEDDGSNSARRERQFKVVIRFAARADLHHLGEFLSGKQPDAPQEALQVLDIVLRELPTQR